MINDHDSLCHKPCFTEANTCVRLVLINYGFANSVISYNSSLNSLIIDKDIDLNIDCRYCRWFAGFCCFWRLTPITGAEVRRTTTGRRTCTWFWSALPTGIQSHWCWSRPSSRWERPAFCPKPVLYGQPIFTSIRSIECYCHPIRTSSSTSSDAFSSLSAAFGCRSAPSSTRTGPFACKWPVLVSLKCFEYLQLDWRPFP